MGIYFSGANTGDGANTDDRKDRNAAIVPALRSVSDLLDDFPDQGRASLKALAARNPDLIPDVATIDRMTNLELADVVSAALSSLSRTDSGVSAGSEPPPQSTGSRSLGVRRSVNARESAPLPSEEDLAFGGNAVFKEAALRASNYFRISRDDETGSTIDLQTLAKEKWTTEAVGLTRANQRSKKKEAPAAKAICLVEHEGELYCLALTVVKNPGAGRAPNVESRFEAGFAKNCQIGLTVTNLRDGSVAQFKQLDDFSNTPAPMNVAQAIAGQLHAKKGEELPLLGFLRTLPGDEDFREALSKAGLSGVLKRIATEHLSQLLDAGSRSVNCKEWEFLPPSVRDHSEPYRGKSRRSS